MDLHDYLNVRRVFRVLASEWDCPVWMVKWIIRRSIDQSWEAAIWDVYFPGGKPTPVQYILRLGHAHEKGETLPPLLRQ